MNGNLERSEIGIKIFHPTIRSYTTLPSLMLSQLKRHLSLYIAKKLKVRNVNLSYLQSYRLCNPLGMVELERYVAELKDGKSSGLDGLSAKIVKSSLPVLREPLLYMFNRSLSEGVFRE